MRRTLYSLVALVVIGIVIGLVAPMFISTEDVRNRLIAEVEDATGYRLRVNGDVDISVFPFFNLVADDVGVAQKSGEGYTEIAKAKQLRFGLSLMSLLSGKARMTEIALVEPVVQVPDTVSDDSSDAPAPGSGDAATGAPASSGDSAVSALQSLSLDKLIIENGTVILPGSGDAPGKRLENLELIASLSSYDAPLSLDLKAVFDGQPFSVAGSISALGPFLEGTASEIAISIEAPSTLAQAVSIVGTAQYTGDTAALDPFTVSSGDSAFGGSVSADLTSEIPQIRASLNGETLDLDALLAASAAKEKDAKAASGGGGNAGGSASEQIDFSALSSIAAQLDLSLSKVVAGGIAIQPVVAAIHVGGGKADVIADLIGVGNASGSASIAIDATRESPYISGKVRISGVDLAAAGKLAATDLPATGTASADIVFATAGRTVQELQGRINASGSLMLDNGAVTLAGLSDAIGDTKADKIESINITARFEDLIKPVTVTGNATWLGERFDLSATGDVRGILADKPSAVEAKATAKRVSAGFKGTVSAKGMGSGRISLSTPSLTGLMVWLGQQPAWQSGFEAFSVDGELTLSDNAISFQDAKIRLDDTHGTGAGKVVFGKKLTLEGRLDLETLDLNPYLGTAGQAPAGQPSASGPAAAGWSDEPIDVSALKAINANLSVSAEQLIYKKIKMGPVGIKAKIAGGKLTANLPDFKLYKGTGSGQLTVNASGKVPAQSFKFSLQNLDAYPFLRDAADFERIEGTGNIAIDLTASGASQRAIVSGLNGTAKFEFANGAIRGINIAKMVRKLTSGTLSGWNSGDAEKTDFASLGSSFIIDKGQARTEDLHMVGPLVRVAGTGSVDMPAQTLNFRVDPKVVASLEGQGSEKEMEGLGVPVIISGPWASPKIYPDIAGILKDPAAAYKQLQKLGGGLFKLPGAGDLGGGNAVSEITDKLKEETGVDINDLLKDGKIDEKALQDGALKGLQQLLNPTPKAAVPAPAAPAPKAAAPAPAKPKAKKAATPDNPDAAAPKKNKKDKKKKNKKAKAEAEAQAKADAEAEPDPEEAAKALLNSLFGDKEQ